MPTEGHKAMNEAIATHRRRRFRLVAGENGRGRVETYVPGEDDERGNQESERPGAERPILRPIAAIPRQGD